MMDGAVDQADHPAEARRQTLRPQMAVEELEQFIGRHGRVFSHPDLVGVHHPPLRKSPDQSGKIELFVADHVCHNVFHCPSGAQRLGLPLFGGQGGQEFGKVGSLITCQAHQ